MTIHERIASGVVNWDDVHEVLIERKHPDNIAAAFLRCEIEVAGELMSVADIDVADIDRHDAWMYAQVVAAESEMSLLDEAMDAIRAVVAPGENLDPDILRARGISEDYIRALTYVVATSGGDA